MATPQQEQLILKVDEINRIARMIMANAVQVIHSCTESYDSLVQAYRLFYRGFHGLDNYQKNTLIACLPTSYTDLMCPDEFNIDIRRSANQTIDNRHRTMVNVREYAMLVLRKLNNEVNIMNFFMHHYTEQQVSQLHVIEKQFLSNREPHPDTLTTLAYQHGVNSFHMDDAYIQNYSAFREEVQRMRSGPVYQYWKFLIHNGIQISKLVGQETYNRKLQNFDPRFINLMVGERLDNAMFAAEEGYVAPSPINTS